MRMKKVLIFHPYLAPYRLDFYNELASFFNLQVLLTGGNKETNTLGFDLKNVNKAAHFHFFYHNKGMYFGRHLISSIYFRKICSAKPDAIFCHELGVNTICAILLKPIFRYKIITTIDDSPSMAMNHSKMRDFLQKLIVKYIDIMLVVHPKVKTFMENKYEGKVRCRFVFFPIIQNEMLLLRKLNDAKTEAKRKLLQYKLTGKKIILFVGRLEKEKCPDQLLRVYKGFNSSSYHLVLVGGGSLKGKLEKYIVNNKLSSTVTLTGQLSGEDLYALYNIAHVFVLPSIFEPFGAVVNEALVAGCKVVVSDSAGAACLVNENNGWTFKAGDENDLKLKIEHALGSVNVNSDIDRRLCQMPVWFQDLSSKLINYIKNPDESRIC